MDTNLRASWERLCDTLKQSADYIFDPEHGVDESEQAEGLRHQLRMFYWAIDRIVENNDPEHPELGWLYPSKVGQDNPDAIYMSAPVDLNRTYRLTGRIDTLRYLGLSLMDFHFGRGEITQLIDVGSTDLTDTGGGRIDVVISPNPDPGDHTGDWFQVEPKTCRLFVRQFFSDWTNESHAELRLECLDPTGPPARLAPARAAALLDDLAREIDTVPKYWTHFAKGHRDRGEINSFDHIPPHKVSESGKGGTNQQAYGQCWYEVGPDEALLLEVTPPDCLYWNIQVGDTWYQSLDYVNLPTTMNDSQARLDPDGVLRLVISHQDPGVQNWIALGGCPQGAITYRWNNADSAPVPTLRLMPASEIGDHLHPDTPRLSADERADLNAERRRHVLRRFMR